MNLAIGQLAREAGVSIDTVRYYERTGLLKPAARAASGYRAYGDMELRRLRFIRRAQRLGFTLAEITDLLALSQQGDVRSIRNAARTRLVDIQARIAELERIRGALLGLVAACPGAGQAADCPILRALNESDDNDGK